MRFGILFFALTAGCGCSFSLSSHPRVVPLDCQPTAAGHIVRCENAEVICYDKLSMDGGLACNFKRQESVYWYGGPPVFPTPSDPMPSTPGPGGLFQLDPNPGGTLKILPQPEPQSFDFYACPGDPRCEPEDAGRLKIQTEASHGEGI